ncbi:MAG: oxidase (noxA-3), partial [Ignavibacteria bacterium]|nr:oxidase (noxA-3) [Ignavibacteria bacterium]
KHIEDKGVFIKTNVSVNEIVAVNEDKLKITFNEETLYTDYIFLCIGSIPETKLAKKTGIRLGKSGGIIVNKYFETNINNIYACGDCTEIMNQVTCKPEWFSNGSFANRQARIVANNISVDGYNNDFEKQSYFGTVNPVSFKIFGLNIASVGLTADSAIKYGLNLASHCATFHDRPHYHPDSKLLFAKIIYKKNNLKIVGLQLIGEGEVTRYIDIFSVLLSRYSNINDLLDLEHCYTPAHSSPLSPLNELAAMVINKEFENIDSIAPFDINTFHGEIIDLREENEVKKNPFKLSSKNIPVNKLRENIPLLDKEKEYLMVCQIGQRSYEATRIMTNTRFSKVKYLEGGISFLNL